MNTAGFLNRVDVLVLTWNEEANLARTLDALKEFPRVVVLDSGSTDATLEIASRYPSVRICSRPFDTHAGQWTHGIHNCGLTSEWVLALDADYVMPAEAVREIASLSPTAADAGYRVRFRYCVDGVPLSGSLYPPVTVLYRRALASYVQDGHAHRVIIDGHIENLREPFFHDDRKSFAFWLGLQDKYARIERDHLLSRAWSALTWRDRIRRAIVIAPWLVPIYCLTIGRGLLDGRHGLMYAMQRGIAEAILSARLIEATLSRRDAS